MSRHHVSPRYGRAILVAVVCLVAGAVDVAAAHEPSKSKAPGAGSGPGEAAPTCHAWAVATRRANAKPGNGSRDVIIKALAQACSAIPEQLRRAAGEVQEMKDPTERAAILGTAASAALGEGCAANEFDESAKFLILAFTLSAEINRDDFQKREERRHRRSR